MSIYVYEYICIYLYFPKPNHFDTLMKTSGIQHWYNKFQRDIDRDSEFRLSSCMVTIILVRNLKLHTRSTMKIQVFYFLKIRVPLVLKF